jgi:hypothetical protein
MRSPVVNCACAAGRPGSGQDEGAASAAAAAAAAANTSDGAACGSFCVDGAADSLVKACACPLFPAAPAAADSPGSEAREAMWLSKADIATPLPCNAVVVVDVVVVIVVVAAARTPGGNCGPTVCSGTRTADVCGAACFDGAVPGTSRALVGPALPLTALAAVLAVCAAALAAPPTAAPPAMSEARGSTASGGW